MRICKLSGCEAEVSGYSTFCDSHKRRNRRHGHPDQLGVTSKELEPFRKLVQARIKKNEHSEVWVMLIKRWEALVAHSSDELLRHQRGLPMSRHLVEAMSDVHKLGQSVEAQDVIEVVLAMYLLEDDSPRRFKSQQAFGRQIVRRVRSLAEVYMGTYYDHTTGGVKRVYRDNRPRTTDITAELLIEAFGVAGVSIARLERADRDRRASEHANLSQALNELT